MLQYIVILLDDRATSFCHYSVPPGTARRLMPVDTLRRALVWAMKRDLSIQLVYADEPLPPEYDEVIGQTEHFNIKPLTPGVTDAQVLVTDDWAQVPAYAHPQVPLVVRTSLRDFLGNYQKLAQSLRTTQRIDVALTDVPQFTQADFTAYQAALKDLTDEVEQLYVDGLSPQLNVLTDRMMLTAMNNCGAGDTTVTLAPDGHFYVCPAFYYAGPCDGSERDEAAVCRRGYTVGYLDSALAIANPQLYQLDHAPICRHCDAWQCRRCVWLNRLTTLEVNTPSHEQCVVAHLERNASRDLLHAVRRHGTFLPDKDDIPDLDTLDPFDHHKEWK